jgi:hypothetical protein
VRILREGSFAKLKRRRVRDPNSETTDIQASPPMLHPGPLREQPPIRTIRTIRTIRNSQGRKPILRILRGKTMPKMSTPPV